MNTFNNSHFISAIWEAKTNTYLVQQNNKKDFVFPFPFCHRYIFILTSNKFYTYISKKPFSFYLKVNFDDGLVNQCSANAELLIIIKLCLSHNFRVSRNGEMTHSRF